MTRKKLGEICNPKQWKTISSDMLTGNGYPVYGANGVIGYYSDYNHEHPTLLITCRGATCGALNICQPFSYVNGNAMALDNLSNEIDIKYLFYYLLVRGLSDVITGSAQPQIVRQSLAKVVIEYPSLSEQHEITATLDKIYCLIAKRKQQLERLDLLVKAKFYEMFGTSDIPITKVGHVLKTTSGGTPSKEHSEYYTNGNIPWLTSGEVAQGLIYKIKNRITEQGLANSSAKWLPVNTVVIAMYGATAGQVGLLKIATTANQAVCGILPNNHFNPLYLYYAVLQKKDWMISQCMGGAQPNISQSIIKKMEIAQPPLNEQNIFAHFVEQTEKIKSKIKQSLEKLELLKQSLLQKYFG